ncbi:MAG: FeoA family protein [Saprospiraceae bacterium]|jgi:ferrous iron transport protein A|nr:ferrous iron transport protein A [Saprospiraceae bacterium]MBK9566622.1 ferrous iron transport protein A [Saprospiraceae bacterium]MBP6445620.1 ferrous iron transport protein A [Saprospiraceae bacterium]
MIALSLLHPGQTGKIIQIKDGIMACKILTHGIIPDKKITMIRRSPFGDAYYVKMENYHIGLRKHEADQIIVEPQL